jgi:LytS/YehU family sensor histidine kinase
MVGFMQWFALRRVVNKRAGFWILASITGFLVSSGIHAAACYYLKTSDDLGNPTGVLMWTLSFIFGGTLTGLLQQRILRHQVRRSGWWVPASAAGWGLGVIGLATFIFVLPIMRKGPVAMLLIRNLIAPTVLGAGLLGIVTAGALIWLLRQPKQQMLDTAT